MKKLIFVLVVMICAVFTNAQADQRGYVTMGYGTGGDASGDNLSLDFGYLSKGLKVTNHIYPKMLVGFGFSVIFNGNDNAPSDLLDYACPHSDWTDKGWYKPGPEIPFFAKLGIGGDTGYGDLFVFGTLGPSFDSSSIQVGQSNVTGWYYTEDSEPGKTRPLVGYGIGYFNKIALTIETDNRRGITGSIGFAF